DRWRKLGENDRHCLLVFLSNADSVEFQIELQRVLADDALLQTFSTKELRALFHYWYEKGDKLGLAQTLQEHPDWEKIAWRDLARVYADYQDYRQAYDTIARFTPRPQIEEPKPRDSVQALAALFRVSPNPMRDG